MKLLGVDEATLPELLPVSRDAMSASYPELATDFARISAVAYAEEEAFRRTLSAGTTLFDTAVAKAKKAGTPALSGDQAFSLHDTYGFPIDVTLEMAAEQGVTVDEEGFRALMKEQRDRARADSRAKRTGAVDVLAYRRLLAEHGPTDWQAYDTLRTDSRVLAVVSESTRTTARRWPAPGEITRVVLDRTPFYAESGGQVADAGVLTWDGGRAEVIDVQRPVKGLVAHQVRVLEGELREGAELTAEVDYEWRLSACQAHSGTHVVHAALRQVLGPQALQSGSYNRPGYLRLDFAWQGALSQQQRNDIEDVANAAVRADHKVTASYMTLPEAQAFGALALFGETYGEQVRVVEIGGPWSRELCGGTHVRGSAQIGTLALTGESSVGSGSRRVEAVVGLEGFRYLARERDLVRQLADLLKAPQDGLVERVSGMLARLRDVDKELAELRGQQTAGRGRAARRVGQGRRRRRRGHRLAGRPGRRRPAHAGARRPWPAAGRRAGGGPAGVGVRWQGGTRGRTEPGRARPRAVGQRRAAGGRRPGRRPGRRQGGRRPGRRNGSRGYPRGVAGRRAGGCDRHREVDQRVWTQTSTTPRTPARSGDGGASCRPSRRRGRVPPAAQPTYHPTTELDLSRGFAAGHQRDQRDRPQRRLARAPEGAAAPASRPGRPGAGRRRRHRARRARAVGPHGHPREPAGDAPPGEGRVRSRPARRARRGTRGGRGGRGESRCICRVRRAPPPRTPAPTLRHWPVACGCAGASDRRKALHRDRGQSPARGRHRQPQAAGHGTPPAAGGGQDGTRRGAWSWNTRRGGVGRGASVGASGPSAEDGQLRVEET